jgi:hypothetical protein
MQSALERAVRRQSERAALGNCRDALESDVAVIEEGGPGGGEVFNSNGGVQQQKQRKGRAHSTRHHVIGIPAGICKGAIILKGGRLAAAAAAAAGEHNNSRATLHHHSTTSPLLHPSMSHHNGRLVSDRE